MPATVTQIESRRNPLVAKLRKLSADGAAYRQLGVVLLEGEHLCTEWLERSNTPARQTIVSAAGWEQPQVRQLAEAAGVEIAIVATATMAAVSSLDSPPPIAFLVPTPEAAGPWPDAPTVVFDRLQDPGNVGSVLRSAATFGFAQAIALAGTAALWAPKVLRAAMGAHFRLRIVEGADLGVLTTLAVPLLATSPHATDRLDSFALPWPCAWVFGHEGQGVDQTLVARCTAMLAIPQPGGGESLNVAAAAAVCFYESARHRAVLAVRTP